MEIAIGRMRSRRFRAEGMGLAPADREATIHGHPVRPRARQRALFRQPHPLDPEAALVAATVVGALRAIQTEQSIVGSVLLLSTLRATNTARAGSGPLGVSECELVSLRTVSEQAGTPGGPEPAATDPC